MIAHSIKKLIELALQEDIGTGDITTEPLIPALGEGLFSFEAKEAFVVAGIDIVKAVFHEIDPALELAFNCGDGEPVTAGTRFGTVRGSMASILTGERVALNFIQRMSAIATNAFNLCTLLKNSRLGIMNLPVVKILDTRKTTAGWRALEKYAVRAGGGSNDRFGLYDAAMIKESHIDTAGGIDIAIGLIRGKIPVTSRICVEVRNFDEVQAAVDAKADIILIDEMDAPTIVEACKHAQGKAKICLSVGSDMEQFAKYAKLPVDYIAVGALTQNVKNVNISLKLIKKV